MEMHPYPYKKKKKRIDERDFLLFSWVIFGISISNQYVSFWGVTNRPSSAAFFIIVWDNFSLTPRRPNKEKEFTLSIYMHHLLHHCAIKGIFFKITLNENRQYILLKQDVKPSKCWSHEIYGSCVRKTKGAKERTKISYGCTKRVENHDKIR